MNTIKIITEFSPEDRKRLDDLTGAVSLLAAAIGNMQPPEVRQQIIQEATAATHPADAPTTHLDPVEEPAPAPDPTPEAKPVSFAEFQKAVTQAVARGPKQKAAAKEIVNKYAASVSEVPEDKRAEVMAELAEVMAELAELAKI